MNGSNEEFAGSTVTDSLADIESAAAPGILLRLVKNQKIAFLIVGGINTVIGFSLFVLFDRLLGDSAGRFGYVLALVFSYAIAILIAFVLHRHFVFRVRGNLWIDLVRFIAVNLFGLGINSILLPLVVESTDIQPRYAQAGLALFVAIVSYLGHKYFSFRRIGN